jgi:TRAP-type C4-dicarboxylate transport system permease small subunit
VQVVLMRVVAVAGRFAGAAAAAALGLAVAAGGVTALARYLFGYAVPDGFDLVRLTGGIAACWGIAAAIAADELIRIDVARTLPRPLAAAVAVLGGVGALAGAVLLARSGVLGTGLLLASGETTADLQLPLWPAHLVMAAGLVVAALLALLRLLAPASGETGG